MHVWWLDVNLIRKMYYLKDAKKIFLNKIEFSHLLFHNFFKMDKSVRILSIFVENNKLAVGRSLASKNVRMTILFAQIRKYLLIISVSMISPIKTKLL